MLNKNLLKQIAAEAQSKARIVDDDNENSSEGCSSEEDDCNIPTSDQAKQVVEAIEESSPEQRRKSITTDTETV